MYIYIIRSNIILKIFHNVAIDCFDDTYAENIGLDIEDIEIENYNSM